MRINSIEEEDDDMIGLILLIALWVAVVIVFSCSTETTAPTSGPNNGCPEHVPDYHCHELNRK